MFTSGLCLCSLYSIVYIVFQKHLFQIKRLKKSWPKNTNVTDKVYRDNYTLRNTKLIDLGTTMMGTEFY